MLVRSFKAMPIVMALSLALPALASEEMSIKLVKRPGTSKMKLQAPKVPSTLPEKQAVDIPVETAEVTDIDPVFEIVSGSMIQAADLDIQEVANQGLNSVQQQAPLSGLEMASRDFAEAEAAVSFEYIDRMTQLNEIQSYVKTNCFNNNSFCDVKYTESIF